MSNNDLQDFSQLTFPKIFQLRKNASHFFRRTQYTKFSYFLYASTQQNYLSKPQNTEFINDIFENVLFYLINNLKVTYEKRLDLTSSLRDVKFFQPCRRCQNLWPSKDVNSAKNLGCSIWHQNDSNYKLSETINDLIDFC